MAEEAALDLGLSYPTYSIMSANITGEPPAASLRVDLHRYESAR